MLNRRELLKTAAASAAVVAPSSLLVPGSAQAQSGAAAALIVELSAYAAAGFGNLNRSVQQRVQLAAGVIDARFDTASIGFNSVKSFYNPENPRLRNTQNDVTLFTNQFLPKFRVQIIYNVVDIFEDYKDEDLRIDGEVIDSATGETRVDASYKPGPAPRISTSWWFNDTGNGLRIQNIKLGPFNIINEARSKFTNEYRSSGWNGLLKSMDRDVASIQRKLLRNSRAG